MKRKILSLSMAALVLVASSCSKLEEIRPAKKTKNKVVENNVKKEQTVSNVVQHINDNNNLVYSVTDASGLLISELEIVENEEGLTEARVKFSGAKKYKTVDFIIKDEQGKIIKSEVVAKAGSKRIGWLIAAILLCCVEGDIDYSDKDGWSGHIGWDCDCFSISDNPTPTNTTGYQFQIVAK